MVGRMVIALCFAVVYTTSAFAACDEDAYSQRPFLAANVPSAPEGGLPVPVSLLRRGCLRRLRAVSDFL